MRRTRYLFLHAFLLVIVTLLALPAAPLSAQSDGGVHMEVTPAYDGYFKYGEWLPIWILLENQGGDMDGEVRVQVNSSQGPVVYAAPVSLPSGSRKLFPVYVLPNNFSRELKVDLVSEGKTVLSESAAVRPQANISYFAGLLAPERGALSLINGVQIPGQERAKILVDLTTANLPDKGEALRSFDLIILNDTDTSKITPEQSSALVDWVSQGGHLVIGGGAGAQKTLAGLPELLVPVTLEGSTEIDADSLEPLSTFAGAPPIQTSGDVVVAAGRPSDGAAVTAGVDNLPLVIQKEIGSGRVDFVALDLAAVPFEGWSGSQAFWETLIGPGGSYPINMPFDMAPRQYRANNLFYALSNIPSLDLPSIQWILVLLGIYIIIVGPVNYLVLRWKNKLHLAWVTIPVITALFTAFSFAVGYTLRGNDLLLNKIALVNLGKDGTASVTSYMGLFSPRQQDYEVTVEGESLLSPMNSYDMNSWGPSAGPGQVTGGEMVFLQGQPSTVRGLTVNQWSMQSFMSEGTWKDFGGITSDLILENDVLKGKVRNDTRHTLTDVAVILQNRFVRLGDMEPGAEKEVNLGLGNLQSDRFGPPISYRLFQENYQGGQLPRLVELKTNIVSSVFENTPWVKTMSSIPAPMGASSQFDVTLIGWMNEAPPEITIQGNNLSYQTTTLLSTSLDYHLPEDGFISLAPGLVPGVTTQMPPNSGTCGVNGFCQYGAW